MLHSNTQNLNVRQILTSNDFNPSISCSRKISIGLSLKQRGRNSTTHTSIKEQIVAIYHSREHTNRKIKKFPIVYISRVIILFFYSNDYPNNSNLHLSKNIPKKPYILVICCLFSIKIFISMPNGELCSSDLRNNKMLARHENSMKVSVSWVRAPIEPKTTPILLRRVFPSSKSLIYL